jgi:hypothetical protein
MEDIQNVIIYIYNLFSYNIDLGTEEAVDHQHAYKDVFYIIIGVNKWS